MSVQTAPLPSSEYSSASDAVSTSAPNVVSGAQALIRCLVEEGVEVLFGYPGGAIMPVYDALYDFQDKLRHVLTRHEQGAVHAAEGYARISGRAGVCIATSGPGATNLVTGIADAMVDSIPLVCITGQVARHILGTDAFQETDVIGITIPITKWNYQITDAAEIAPIMAKAFHIAQSGRPGPVLIDITKDAQFQSVAFEYQKVTNLAGFEVPSGIDSVALDQATDLLNKAERPYILAGHGVELAGAQLDLLAVAEKAQIPVACTLHGLSSFPTGHPLYAGMLGMHGNYGSNVNLNRADVVLAVGMRFDDRVTGDPRSFLRKAKVIHVDIDPAEIDKIVETEVALIADAGQALRALKPRLKNRDRAAWIDQFVQANQIEIAKIVEPGLSGLTPKPGMIEVVHALSEATRGEAIVVADVGQHQMMAARYYRFSRPSSWVTSGGLGTMGFALPAAMGCALADRERTTLAIIGDGCFQMTLQELATIVQEQLPIKIVILNNNFLGMVRQWQELFFQNRYSFVQLKNPDFVAIARGFGLLAERVTLRESLNEGISTMFESEGPYLLEVVVETEENVFPMVPSGASVDEMRLE